MVRLGGCHEVVVSSRSGLGGPRWSSRFWWFGVGAGLVASFFVESFFG